MRKLLCLCFVLLTSCTFGQQDSTMTKHTNSLINETSPYLLQHAHNPVNWYPWGKEALNKAKEEDKPIILSIGYSSCHWCHVMEHESFEKEDVAEIMNEHFVCIKVDREERPDIDQIYMEAMQSMGLGGGWPLNAFLTPDTKPFHGGTYFSNTQWKNTCKGIAKAYKEKKNDVNEVANKTAFNLSVGEVQKYGLTDTTINYTREELNRMYKLTANTFDYKHGGTDRAPKFPMPSIYLFLLRYYQATGDSAALNHVNLTLTKMAEGGIYDQIGGGFSRYSVDSEWFAPHFEKMLYDNGQLVSLYSEAYTVTGNEKYKIIIEESLAFIQREMTNPEGGFYSGLDADSEGEEGKFYVWSYDEIQELLGKEADAFCDYYNVKPHGNWELENILYVDGKTDVEYSKLKKWKSTLLEERSKRIRPGLDDKTLLNWNALMMKGYISAYNALGNEEYLKAALRNANFIELKMKKDEQYFHTYKEGKASLLAFLDDYALLIDAYIALYQATFDEQWLTKAKAMTTYSLKNFYDESENMFFYTDQNSESLIARKKEVFDNVIPASNSVMATNLHWLGIILDNEEYTSISDLMLARTKKILLTNPSFLAHWGSLYTYKNTPTAEVIIVGKDYKELAMELQKTYLPNKIVAGTNSSSKLPLLQSREAIKNKPTIYVCFNKSCKLPVHTIKEALLLIK